MIVLKCNWNELICVYTMFLLDPGYENMTRKEVFEQIKKKMEQVLKPEHIINEKYAEQNYWMMVERAKMESKNKKDEKNNSDKK